MKKEKKRKKEKEDDGVHFAILLATYTTNGATVTTNAFFCVQQSMTSRKRASKDEIDERKTKKAKTASAKQKRAMDEIKSLLRLKDVHRIACSEAEIEALQSNFMVLVCGFFFIRFAL